MPESRFVTLHVLGAEQMRRKLLRGAAAAGDMAPALEVVADDMMRTIKETFKSQGRRYGGSWTFLQPETIKRKLAKGQDPKILMASHKLMDSLTIRDAPFQILHVGKDEVWLGTDLDYAATHQHGDHDRGIPARPFINFYPPDRQRWVRIVENHLRTAIVG